MHIKQFQNEYRFLSNFWPATVIYDSLEFPNVETAYQYSKFDNKTIKTEILEANSASEAKRLARNYKDFIRPNFYAANIEIMYELLRSKFSHAELSEKLLATGDATLSEGNTWNDTFWGVDLRTGKGHNNLGKLLMRVREEIRTNTNTQSSVK